MEFVIYLYYNIINMIFQQVLKSLILLYFWVFVLLKLTFVIYCYMMYLIKKGGFTP